MQSSKGPKSTGIPTKVFGLLDLDLKYNLQIDLSHGVLLSGDLTDLDNFVHQSNRQENKLTLVDLNLVCIDIFRGGNKIPSDVHSCLFHAITSKEEEMIGSHAA